MIRIKDYIFDEDIITEIHKIDDVLNVYERNGNIDYIKDASFEDIEWNYPSKEIEYLYKRNQELEDYKSRNDKSLKDTEELYKITKEQDSDNVNLIDRLEIILKTLKGE